MEQFAAYGHAIVALALTTLFGLLVGPLTAVAKMTSGMQAGATPDQSYDDRLYRFNRAYLNLVETMGFFVASVLAAILAGVSPYWVNLLASVFFISRLAVFAVHAAGIGPMNFGPRTFIFVVGWLCCLVMSVMAVIEVFAAA
ncbi:MAPEG family protein [Roseivivax sp. THAF40]|uniref:MAPEG family protein n=1 Tax=unclassified Roseivivax TaxID=2639302 RepID=UPI001268E830|nr:MULTISPECIES: MAPEG family protein [unclassified Roseivivax]QFS82177.1 MAPEG family protein [Roseivivax sp. THAF197b]QFT45977.1 MAPEG family protein [Roseivivax sp. THAF40]